ncbi:MAG: MBOAT family protein, partial [Melioribacteraceae bacterium]
VFEVPLRFTGLENLFAVYGYALQIYCDFSGYTDMAIGIALLLGFKLMDNFNYPFKAASIADFWRRWHISLSKWLLDYLFKPIQMSARSLRVFGNVTALLITFLICGIWHGAGWNYILWGAFHGAMMSFSLFIQKPRTKLFTLLKINNTNFLKFFQVVFTFHLVVFSFMIFKSNDFQTVTDMLGQIINFFHGEIFFQFIERLPVIFILIVLGYLFHFLPNKVETYALKIVTALPLAGKAVLLAIVIWIAVQFKSADILPFIYFQF